MARHRPLSSPHPSKMPCPCNSVKRTKWTQESSESCKWTTYTSPIDGGRGSFSHPGGPLSQGVDYSLRD
jgi:hypothetical protein